MTMQEAIGRLLGPIAADVAVLLDGGDPDAPLTIEFLSYRHETTLRVLQDLDRAHAEAHDRSTKAAISRRNRKAGELFP